MRNAFVLLVLTSIASALAGCAPVDLEGTISDEARQAPRPEIKPLTPVLTAPEARIADTDAEELLARAEQARARAKALQ